MRIFSVILFGMILDFIMGLENVELFCFGRSMGYLFLDLSWVCFCGFVLLCTS